MNPTRLFWFRRRMITVAVPIIALACAGPTADAQGGALDTDVTGDVVHGWRVFHQKKCVECHAIWDQGAHIGPDLGRSRTRPLSNARVAGVMWNHIPRVLARMKAGGHAPPTLTRDDMAHLLALLVFVRGLDEPGSPARGRDVLRNKGCASCHSLYTSDGHVGSDLTRWSSYGNSIIWSQIMWEHAPLMDAAMQQTGERWPQVEGSDLMDIVAYVRSVGTGGANLYLHPGSISNGREQFAKKGCTQCHPGAGPDLSTADLPASVGALASRMWKHSPETAKLLGKGADEREPSAAQELTDILTYVLALNDREPKGDIGRGAQVFTHKGCGSCHQRKETGHTLVPIVTQLRRDATPVDMATALWNHGKTMLERTSETGATWPVFDDGEMVDLLAFLGSLETSPGPAAQSGSK